MADQDRITGAGGTAPPDMMHAPVAGHHDADFARQVGDRFMHAEMRSAGDPPRGVPRHRPHAVPVAMEAMENHVADTLSRADAGWTAGASTRQLNRQYGAALDRSAGAFCRGVRLEKFPRAVASDRSAHP